MLRCGNKLLSIVANGQSLVLKEQEHLPLHPTHLQSQPGDKAVFFRRCFSMDIITLLLQKKNVIKLLIQEKLPA